MEEHKQCQEWMAELSEFVDGTLSSELCEELQKHLDECGDCKIVVNTLQKTIELYHETSEVTEPMPAGVRERLFTRLNLEDYLES